MTVELLPEKTFRHRIETLIKQSKSKVSIVFSRFLFLIQTVNHGNALMTTYGTNFQYLSLQPMNDFSYLYIEAMIYDDNCPCGLTSTCTTQAIFINESIIMQIVGFKMGCLPGESF